MIAMSLLFASGVGLAVSPWVFGFIGEQAPAFSSKIVSMGLMLVGLAAYVELRDWAFRGAIVTALCSFVAPFLLGFHDLAAAAWVHGAAGAFAVLAAFVLLRAGQARLSAKLAAGTA
jgi:hypothetical protein